MEKIQAISFFFSAECNMQCAYCFTNGGNHAEMAAFNKEIRDSINNGEYIRKIKDLFENTDRFDSREDILSLGLWGMEPTINASSFKKFVFEILDYFPNADRVFFSTNSWLGSNPLSNIAHDVDEYCLKNDRDIELTIQFSLDGPARINDRTRRIGATDRTIKAYKDLILECQDIKKALLHLCFKATANGEIYKELLEDETLLDEFYTMFDELFDFYEENNKNKQILNAINYAAPSFAVPDDYSTEDGKNIAALVRKMKNMDYKKYKHLNHPTYTYLTNFINDKNPDGRPYDTDWTLYCSSGVCEHSIDHRGNFYSCHTIFKRGISKTSAEYMDRLDTVNAEENYPILERTMDLLDLYSDSVYSYFSILCDTYATYGLIDKKYKNSEAEKRKLFVATSYLHCKSAVADVSGSIYVYAPSLLKAYGNGFIDEILDYQERIDILMEEKYK